MAYNAKIEALNQRKPTLKCGKNEVNVRLPGNKTTGMGKYCTRSSKTIENAQISLEGKRGIEKHCPFVLKVSRSNDEI